MSKNILKIVSIAGARPNFMKIAPIIRAIEEHNSLEKEPFINHILVHTGQHYDEKMSKLFFDELNIPKPDYNLEVGSGSHAVQTAEIMKRFEPVVIEEKPDYVLVVGDVNSTIACALVAKKLNVKVIHVEAGLRSFDMGMPEEINRILTDSISDILFTTERSGDENLLTAGVGKDKIHFVGNVMIDTLLTHRERAARSTILTDLHIKPQHYAVVTLHRPSNVDDQATFGGIMTALNEVASAMPVIFPVHPRTTKRLSEWDIPCSDAIRFVEPLGYIDFLRLVSEARIVLTDSGGIQEETTVLGVPCVTLRNNTERPVTVIDGTNHLAGIEPKAILKVTNDIFTNWQKPDKMPELWDGKAAERIVNVISSTVL
jgi:UDP-N-acetylglucosamine 2-epimerase (non-hydrolysing)